MPKFLYRVSYSVEGTKGVLKEGGTSRRDSIAKLAEGLGGKLESFYFAFGKDDVYAIFDLPDNQTAAALSLTVAASGAASPTTVVLITPEELDEATKTSVAYRPPGA